MRSTLATISLPAALFKRAADVTAPPRQSFGANPFRLIGLASLRSYFRGSTFGGKRLAQFTQTVTPGNASSRAAAIGWPHTVHNFWFFSSMAQTSPRHHTPPRRFSQRPTALYSAAMSNPLRWGILGTGNIARQFCGHFPTAKRSSLAAVGSRSHESASTFARQFRIPTAHGSYDALLADRAVDAIYNSLPKTMHHEWTINAQQAGKHVHCEKPIATNFRPTE